MVIILSNANPYPSIYTILFTLQVADINLNSARVSISPTKGLIGPKQRTMIRVTIIALELVIQIYMDLI